MQISELPVPRWQMLLLLGGCLFTFGLSAPKFAALGALFILVIGVFSGRFLGVFNPAFFARMFLLAAFSGLYYAVLVSHWMIGLGDFIKWPLLYVSLYVAGYAFTSASTPQRARATAWLLLALALGFLAYGFASVVKTGFPLKGLYLPYGALSIWGEGLLHKTGGGVFGSLGMCLFVAAIATRKGEPQRWLWFLVCIMAAIAGFSVNLALQNRTPLLAMGLASLLGSWVLLREHARTGLDLNRLMRWVLIAGVAMGIAAVALYHYMPLLLDTVFARFRILGVFETPRFHVWQVMLAHLFDFPFGGRQIRLPENYAHNVWLDAVYDVGILVTLLLLAFHFSHLRALRDCFTRLPELRLRVTMVVISTSLIFSFLVEPIMSASAYIFGASCFYLGVSLRLSHELRGVRTWFGQASGRAPTLAGARG